MRMIGPRIALAGLLLAAVPAGASHLYDSSANRELLITAVMADAREQNMRVFVEIGAVLEQGYLHMRIPVHEALVSKWAKAHLKVSGDTPELFVVGGDGRLLVVQATDELEKGHGYDREKVMGFMKKWATPGAVPTPDAGMRNGLLPEIERLASPRIVVAGLPVVVYVYSPKAAGARGLATSVENLAVEYSGRAQFFSINADKGDPGAKTGAIPGLVLVKGGRRRKVAFPAGERADEKLGELIALWLAR